MDHISAHHDVLIAVALFCSLLNMCKCVQSLWLLSQQGAQTLLSMERLKNVTFEEEYTKLFPPEPN